MKGEEFFYPGYGKTEPPKIQSGAAGLQSMDQTDSYVPTSADTNTITANTQLVLQVYDRHTDEMTETVGRIPQKYVGMNREQFVSCLADEYNAPLLKEKKEGIEYVEVVSFSYERIVVKKSYQKTEDASGFYLVLEQSMVTIYESDRRTLYMRTAINAVLLPEEVRRKLLYGMELETQEELEKFLESYST